LKDTRIIDSGFYPIYIGSGIYHVLNNFLQLPRFKKSRFFIITDENCEKYCLPDLLDKVSVFGEAKVIVIPPGEHNKNLNSCGNIWHTLTEAEADRHSVVVNLGGGVVTDLGGFAAATYMRGIRFINVPTSLVGQIDSAIGGKLGFDYENLKNQIGLYLNPQAVFIDPAFLETIPPEHHLSGFAEIIKYGLIHDASFYRTIIEEPYHPEKDLMSWIVRSVEIKVSIVKVDPFERKYRKVLNFGHSIGHALESASLISGGTPLSHGLAVAAGMVCETYLSGKLSGLQEKSVQNISKYLISNFETLDNFAGLRDQAKSLLMHDKKNEDGKILMTLLSGIGHAVVNQGVSLDLVRESMDFYQKLST